MIEINETVAYLYGAIFGLVGVALIVLGEVELRAKKRKGQGSNDNG